jgi:hypothetical protein
MEQIKKDDQRIDYEIIDVSGLNLTNLHQLLTPYFRSTFFNSEISFQYLEPGLMDSNNIFYSCPLILDYVQINSFKRYSQTKTENRCVITRTEFEIDITVFNFDFSEHITEILKTPTRFWNFNNLYPFFRIINEYCASKRDIKLIDLKKTFSRQEFGTNFLNTKPYHLVEKNSNKNPYCLEGKSFLIDCIDQLEFKFYFNSCSQAQRDYDLDWLEIEIRNVPTHLYIKQLMNEFFCKYFWDTSVGDFGLLVRYKSDNCVSYYGRHEDTEDRKDLIANIKNTLIIFMIENFNALVYEFSFMIKEE